MLRRLIGLRPRTRNLSGLEQLVTGDIVEFGFCDLADISDRRFQVFRRVERDFGDSFETSWLIRAQATILRLQAGLNEKSGDVILKRAVARPYVESIFDMQAFISVFEPGFTGRVPVLQLPSGLKDWLDPSGYAQNVDARPARSRVAPEGSWLDYDLYVLQGRSLPDLTVEIEVYRNETDVFLTRSFGGHVIERIWPAGEA